MFVHPMQCMEGEDIALVGAKSVAEVDSLQDLINEVRGACNAGEQKEAT